MTFVRLAGGCVARRLRIDLDMRPPTASPARTALPAAHFDRNERYAYFGDRTLREVTSDLRMFEAHAKTEDLLLLRVNLSGLQIYP